ncbi:rod shape-determining protein [Candidatus Saccharibacteria bacterium]|nr:rod shape-determining protein [Candidatus Saccharibacteria bacterium]MCL1963411.1 rod shape-determining protein [Candidatus Saccharibacteria bacterium]
MKLFQKNKDQDDEYIVALDIGTEYAKALIARIDDNKLRVVGVGRARQEIGNMFGGAIADITGVVRTCEDALVQAEEQSGVQAKRVIIGIAGEFVKGLTSTIRYKRPHPDRELDIAEMELIIEKIQERASTKAQKQIAFETGNPDVEVKLVNSAIVNIHIDGYKVSNPIGFQGRDVAIQIYTAFAPMVHIGALEHTATELDLKLIAVAAEPFAVARAVLGDDTASTFTAILCDVGGGSTDIAVVNDGGVEGTRMFGVAGRSFTKTIASDLNIGYEAAEKLKLNIYDEKIKPSIRSVIDESIDKTLEVWIAGVQLALGEFDAIDHLPNRILLCGGGSSLDALVEKLQNSDWYEDLPFTKRPTVKYINPDDVVDVVDETGDMTDHTMITAAGLLRVGYDTINGGGTTTDWKDKLNRILRI